VHFDVAAGVTPAVEPGVPPGGRALRNGKARPNPESNREGEEDDESRGFPNIKWRNTIVNMSLIRCGW